MCRFLAYIGPEPIYIDQLIDHDNNSMIKQSRQAHEGRTRLNADGFGVGWCNETMDSAPALYRSILPAWNDQNLQDLARSIRSSCFFGHVRSSTVGDVGLSNCHPFTSNRYMFVHNGTIERFSQIKRQIINAVSDDLLMGIKGTTDSECLFALVQQNILDLADRQPPEALLATALQAALSQVLSWLRAAGVPQGTTINTALTDGTQLVASRFIDSDTVPPHSLYIASGPHTPGKAGATLPEKAVIIASERLTDCTTTWEEVPMNHLVQIDTSLQVTSRPLNLSS